MRSMKSVALATTLALLSLPAVAQMSAADKSFATNAAAGGLAEVSLGKLATQKATSEKVRAFGQQMVTDHTQANQELMQLAQKEHLTLPKQPTAQQQADERKLRSENGPAFDTAYMRDMLQDHRKDVAEFQKEAQNGRDPGLKAFAQKYLPILQNHLKMAESAQTPG